MLKKLTMILLAVGLSGALGGCLVKKKDPSEIPTYTSTDPVLRFYQPGDTINYLVQAQDGVTTRTGTLQIKWENTNPIPSPFPPNTYTVLKETTTLTLGQTSPVTDTLVRYVEQDTTTGTTTTGSMYLRAFDSPTAGEYFWLSPSNVPTSSVQRFEIFRSPLDTAAMAGQIDLGNYYVVDNCNGTTCNDQLAFIQSNTFEVTASNQTVDIPGTGIFKNVYKVQYNATMTPGPTTPLLDILNVCGGTGQVTSHQTVLYIVPEIGVIKMVNTCTDQGGGAPVIYIATLDTTTFQY
ncbi:MAG TPA: hypothetical protein ENI97_13810 [Gammaproteobacteria bacterium]|nr:hypothetical protein [Gammaproteobacteria bacterium]